MLMRTIALQPAPREGCREPVSPCAACDVRGSALFGSLPGEALRQLPGRIDRLALEPDETIYSRGSVGTPLFTIRSGVVRFERATAGGDRRIVRLAGRGDMIGQEALLSAAYADDAVACTPVELCRIPRGVVESLAERDAALWRELMRRWQSALEDAEDWSAELAMGPARTRLLRLLARLGRLADAGHLIWMPRREEMSAMLDMALETASRLVSQMRREGLFEVVGPRGARLRPAALQQALQREEARG